MPIKINFHTLSTQLLPSLPMASILLLPTCSLLSPSSPSHPFLHPTSRNLGIKKLLQPETRTHQLSFNKEKNKGFVRGAALDESPVLDPFARFQETGPEVIASLKIKLLSAVSGLNRGLAATEEDLQKAESAAKELEAVGETVDLTKDLDKLQGRWKLLYSSAFSSRALGGSRPGPPTGRLLPITLGQVFQRIDILGKDFDNIVELQFGTPWPIPPIEATATLAHKFDLIGSASLKINFVKTTVKPTGNLAQVPPFEVPQLPDALRPPTNRGSGEFEVTYLDSDTRITRGDRGELRVFVIS